MARFSATPNQADIINTQLAVVPNPSALLLVGLGAGLLGTTRLIRRS